MKTHFGVGSRRENRGGSEGTTSVPRETTSPSTASSGAAGVNPSAGAGQPSASSRDLVAFGWVLRRLAAIGLAALDSVGNEDRTDLRDAIKPFLDALSWEGVKLTRGKPETD